MLMLALVLINSVTWVVVTENQRNGLYPVEGDSISIPIFGTLGASVFVFPFLVLIGVVPGARFLQRLCAHGWAGSVCAALLLVSLYLAAARFTVHGAGSWAFPHHYGISVCYLVLLVLLAMLFVLDARWLLSHWSLNRTRARIPRADERER
jgi:hypothetical protein